MIESGTTEETPKPEVFDFGHLSAGTLVIDEDDDLFVVTRENTLVCLTTGNVSVWTTEDADETLTGLRRAPEGSWVKITQEKEEA